MQSVVLQYRELQEHNTKLESLITEERAELDRLQKSAADGLLEGEENELSIKRRELDQSEQEEAALLVELESLLKGMESSLSLSVSTHGGESLDLEQTEKKIDHRQEILHHLCECYVREGKAGVNEAACALDIILRHDNSVSLSTLKSEMRSVISDKGKVLPVGFLSFLLFFVDNLWSCWRSNHYDR